MVEEVFWFKSEFLVSIIYEFCILLNGIIGFLWLILDDMVDLEVEKYEFVEEVY